MAENEWFILIGQERQGPLSVHDVRYLLTRRNIDGGTLVWREGMESWVRLREVEEFRPKKKEEEAEGPEEAPPPPPPAEASSSRARLLQRLIPALLTLGLVGGAVYVYVTDDTPPEPAQSATSPIKRTSRSPQQLVEGLKRGERGARNELIRSGSKGVPALIEALMEKGSPLAPKEVRAILIEIGPSSASAIGEALEGLDLSKASQIILVEVLGEFGGLSSVPALIIALGAPDPTVQQRAIDAIAKLNPDFGPALARHLTSPVEELSKQQKVNLAKALGEHRSPKSIPQMEKAQQTERDRDVIAALARAVDKISRNPRTSDPVPPVVVQTPAPENTSTTAEAPPPQSISVSVSATATATATAESEEKEDSDDQTPESPGPEDVAEAERLAEEGRQLREEGREDEALAKYRQAYALHPIRAYLIIILELEGDADASPEAPDTTAQDDLPEIEAPKQVSLDEIYEEMELPEPDLGSYSGTLGSWTGTIDDRTPFARDGRRDLFIARSGSGQAFIAAVRRREVTVEDIGAAKEWRGTLQGFRVTQVDGEDRMLPVLLVE